MDVLVVDSEAEVRLLFFSASDEIGGEVYFAESEAEALQILADEDSIGVAVIAHNTGEHFGIPLAKTIRTQFAERHIPILFLSDTSDTQVLVELLEHGDDVVIKPFSQPVLLAKLLAHRRTRSLYQQIESQIGQLERYRAQIDMEHHIAADVFSRIQTKTLPRTPGIHTFASPYSSFNGDLALVMARPGEGFNVLIADITGHGLPAALGTMPVSEIFFAMTQRGFGINDIAREMNSAFRARMPDYLLCAAILISVVDNGRRAQIWSGGMPPLVVFDANGRQEALAPSMHMALGALSDQEFDDAIFSLTLEQGQRLICYTDGVTETSDAKGEMFGEDRLLAALHGNSGGEIVKNLADKLYEHAGGDWLSDDVTIFCFDNSEYTGISDFSGAGAERHYAEWNGFEWKTSIHFTAAQLRNEQPLDLILKALPTHPMVLAARADLSIIINELFVNALDHGLLKLDSALKEGDDGLLNYFMEREQRLQQLEEGHIAFDLHNRVENGICYFSICCRDSGNGFNLKNALAQDSDEMRHSGRGLQMIAAMCEEIAAGTTQSAVELRYRWPARETAAR
jgi:serine phosphatase RsbU (regulator of sigma subunit)